MLIVNARTSPGHSHHQEAVRRLRESIATMSCMLATYPGQVVSVLEAEPWQHQRLGRDGERIRPAAFADFVERRYPYGIGSSVATLHRLLAAAAPWAAPADVIAASNLLNRTLKEGSR